MGKKKEKSKKLMGEAEFDLYYENEYGNRWNELKKSLFQDNVYVRFCQSGQSEYFLDPASVCAALSLPLGGKKKIVDLCAAPGGKTLILSSTMDEDAFLFSNERSAERKARLVKVVDSSLPSEISCRIKTSCSDGARWCKNEIEAYGAVFLDAPCSSERHVLSDSKYLDVWTPSRVKTLSMEQWALLSSAWRLLEKDGFLVYGTCALASAENDGVLERLIKKFDDVEFLEKDKIKEVFTENLSKVKSSLSMENKTSDETCERLMNLFFSAEKTIYGYHILPDSSFGAGPIYWSVLHKASKKDSENSNS